MTNLASRVTVVLNEMPKTEERMNELVEAVVMAYKPEATQFTSAIVKELPATLPVHEADQLRAAKRDAGAEGRYLVVWMI